MSHLDWPNVPPPEKIAVYRDRRNPDPLSAMWIPMDKDHGPGPQDEKLDYILASKVEADAQQAADQITRLQERCNELLASERHAKELLRAICKPTNLTTVIQALNFAREFVEGTTFTTIDPPEPAPTPAPSAPILSAVALLRLRDPENRFLCVYNKRYKGWCLPGGKVEEGETPLAACLRELEEETGLKGRTPLACIYEGDHRMKVESTRGSRVMLFHVPNWTGIVHPEDNTYPQPRWMTREEFLRESCFAPFYERVFKEIDL